MCTPHQDACTFTDSNPEKKQLCQNVLQAYLCTDGGPHPDGVTKRLIETSWQLQRVSTYLIYDNTRRSCGTYHGSGQHPSTLLTSRKLKWRYCRCGPFPDHCLPVCNTCFRMPTSLHNKNKCALLTTRLMAEPAITLEALLARDVGTPTMEKPSMSQCNNTHSAGGCCL